MIGKTIMSGGKTVRINLTEEEEEKVSKELLEKNSKEMRRCLEESRKVVMDLNLTGDHMVQIACSLFEKQSTASYTAIQEAVEKKILNMKK